MREAELPWSGLLMGNGASIAVSDSFRYDSLFAIASSDRVEDPLSAEDHALFGAFDTSNFEHVLGGLKIAKMVVEATGQSVAAIEERYNSIQQALFQAIGPTHISWLEAAHTLGQMRRELRRYGSVYSTNYDLLVYWSIMNENGGAGFKDMFWGGDALMFDPADTGIPPGATRVLYLHGGIHLRQLPSGGTRKQVAEGQNLLTQFPTSFEEPEVPLLISEGTSADKLASIARSDYLSFAFQNFSAHESGLAIFGHSLGQADDHLVRVINSWRPPWRRPSIAVSIRRTQEEAVQQRKTWLANRLPYADLYFFDSATHPLGEPGMRAGDVLAA